MSDAVAAIDIGTNTVLQLVARRGERGELEVLDDRSTTARLGAGLARTGHLDDDSIARTVDVLASYLELARDLGVSRDRVRAVGTAVLRRASDASRFLDACRARLELEVEVLSEGDEARIGHAAVAAGSAAADAVVVDVGGGSSEVVTDAGRSCLSAPIGAVVLTERFLGLGDHPPSGAGGWPALLDAVRLECERFPAEAGRDADVVLIGGTAANLACLVLGLPRFDPARIEGVDVRPAAAGEWATRLHEMPFQERLSWPVEADRAEILPAGLACVAGALERLTATAVRVSGRGLRYGVANALFGAD